jgi:hypothetical protein
VIAVGGGRDGRATVFTDRALVTSTGAVMDDGARLSLVGLRRDGDGYLVHAVGHLPAVGGTRRHFDIGFGNVGDRGGAADLDAVVRRVKRWCDDGTPVSMIEVGGLLVLRAADGSEATLPAPGPGHTP